MKCYLIPLLAALALVASGCSEKKSPTESDTQLTGEVAKAGSLLAYEHTIDVSTTKDMIEPRVAAIRSACIEAKFGACNLLASEVSSGEYHSSGRIVVRVVPEAVEPLSAMASEGGEVGSRSTRAEDLAVVIADTAREEEQLERQRATLVEFQGRKDLAVSDMLSLASELASVETQLAELTKSQSIQQRRLETNLLTISLSARRDKSSWSSVPESLSEAMGSFGEGTAEAISTIAFSLPFLLLAFPLALLWRFFWRRLTAKDRTGAT